MSIIIFTCAGVAFDVQGEPPAVEGDRQAPPKIRCGEFAQNTINKRQYVGRGNLIVQIVYIVCTSQHYSAVLCSV